MTKSRLWRVDAQHLRGAHAPHLYVETTSPRMCDAEVEALKAAKEMSVFSTDKRMRKEGWHVSVSLVSRRNLNGKWYSESEFMHKTGHVRGLDKQWYKLERSESKQ